MTQVIETRIINSTRKPHLCYGCDRRFPLGTKMIRDTYLDDRVVHAYWCLECNAIVQSPGFELDLLIPGELGYTDKQGVFHYYGESNDE